MRGGDKISQHWRDSKGREIGRCTYCLREGNATNLRKMPMKYRDDEYDLGREYCPDCYEHILNETKKLPWNREK